MCFSSSSRLVLVFTTFKDMKMVCVLTPYQDGFSAMKDKPHCLQNYLIWQNLFLERSSYTLMHRFFLHFFLVPFVLFNTYLEKTYIILF